MRLNQRAVAPVNVDIAMRQPRRELRERGFVQKRRGFPGPQWRRLVCVARLDRTNGVFRGSEFLSRRDDRFAFEQYDVPKAGYEFAQQRVSVFNAETGARTEIEPQQSVAGTGTHGSQRRSPQRRARG